MSALAKDICNITVSRSDLACPICRETIHDVYSAPCGHSFCYECIVQNLQHRPLCPCCSSYMTKDNLYPNALLDKLVRNAELVGKLQKGSALERLKHTVTSNSLDLSVLDIEELQKILQDTKRRLAIEDTQTELLMLKSFLSQTKEKKITKVQDLASMISRLQMDIAAAEKYRDEIREIRRNAQKGCVSADSTPSSMEGGENSESSDGVQQVGILGEELAKKKQLAFSQFDELAGYYMRMCRQEGNDKANAAREVSSAALMGKPSDRTKPDVLDCFARTLSICMYRNKLEVLSEINLESGMLSSIEFNSDGSVLAAAGVSKRIRILSSEVVKQGDPGAASSGGNMVTRGKLGSLSWNKLIKNQLVSSDNEGVLTLWDASAQQIVQDYEAHEKRIWSVDFCPSDPYLIASGSDDGKVKIWSIQQGNAVLQLDVRVNVCSVCYNKLSSNLVAVGSADHIVRVYDLRNPGAPLNVLAGHNKAISYVDFPNENELVSASTDSTLRLWDITKSSQVRVFSGHKNMRNFVGMSVDQDFIACGSETNEVFVYYKAISRPHVVHSFKPTQPQEFMSAVTWQPHTSDVFAVSSSGVMKVLRLTD